MNAESTISTTSTAPAVAHRGSRSNQRGARTSTISGISSSEEEEEVVAGWLSSSAGADARGARGQETFW